MKIDNNTVSGATPIDAAGPSDDSPAERLLRAVATSFAMGAGVLLIALIVMCLTSIVGLQVFSTPIQGSVELMQMGIAICGTAFFPICEINNEHIKVEALTNWLPTVARRYLDAVSHIFLTIVFALLSCRTAVAAINIWYSGEISTLLSIPLWIPMVLLVPSLLLTTVCALFRTIEAFGTQKVHA